MRLIDADELLKQRFDIRIEINKGDNHYSSVVYADDIDDCQTIDATQVVRCRDCIYSEDTGDYQDTYFCHNQSHNAQVLVHSREYCSHGKKMKGADDED